MTGDYRLNEIQRSLDNATKKMEELESTIERLRKDIRNMKSFIPGDKIITSMYEDGEIISVNGPKKYPVIALIHRNDVGRDDVACFNTEGKFGTSYSNRCGLSEEYTIKKK